MTRGWVLFDFDGTLTARDTTRDLVLALLAARPWRAVFVLPFAWARLQRSALRLQRAKEQCIGRLIAGLAPARLARALERYRAAVTPLLRPAVLRKLDEALAAGHPVAVVSASPQFALQAIFSPREGLHLVGTRYRRVGEVHLAALDGEPCYGEAKVAAVNTLAAARGAPHVHAAWSDSASDLPMMMMASERYWICGGDEAARVRSLDPGARFFDVAA